MEYNGPFPGHYWRIPIAFPVNLIPRPPCRCLCSLARSCLPLARTVIRFVVLCVALAGWAQVLRANVPAAIVTGTGQAVTLTDGGSTVTLSNGIVSILCTKSGATINQINYTYNTGTSTKTTQLLNGGTDGGMLYWEYGGFGGSASTYSIVVNPATGDSKHPVGDYAEIDLLSTSSTNGTVDIHFSMFRGSPGFYVTAIWNHRSTDDAMGMGETRSNIYAGNMFNWMSVDPARNKLMAVSTSNTSIAVPGAPKECYLWTSGIYQGLYDDKYKYSADFDNEQYVATPRPHRVWGWSSVGTGGDNVGLWDVNASSEYVNCGPIKRELMCHIGTTILNMFNGSHYTSTMDATYAAGEPWTKVYGPYFVYCNNVPASTTDPYQASQALYNDAVAQGNAEASGTASTAGATFGATAWPYGWFINSAYTLAAGRGTVTGKIVINDTGNPSASGSNLFVGIVQQPTTSISIYDYQAWMKPYQFWVRADANGNFAIPDVISGTNYTLYAFGQGAPGEFMSQNQTGGNPPITYNLPATPFSVTVASGSTTALGTVTWTPTRVGPTLFEIGYPDRTSRKFRHGDDFWVGDIGPSATAPSPIWTKYLEYPFDFPKGLTYNVGTNRWNTDWNFVQPVITTSGFSYNNSTSTITFSVPSAPANGALASIYLGLVVDMESAVILTLNGTNLASASGVTATPNAENVNGYYAAYGACDTTIREGNAAQFTDERVTFPASLLKSGTNLNTLTIGIRQVGGTYFADGIMFDYLRMELAGYLPPAPASVTAYPGKSSMLLGWPLVPGASAYNISRSSTSGTSYKSIATGLAGPVNGSGPQNATWLDTTATNGDTYYYVVQSVNTTGTSAYSTQSAAAAPSSTGPTAAPAAPATVTATAGQGQVSVNWTASANANYYIVQRSVYALNGGTILGGLASSSEDYNILNTITLTNTATGTSYIDPTVTNGSTYSYAVSAVNASGTSAVVTSSNSVPLAAAPSTAPVLTGIPGIEQVTLNWTAATGAVGYVIEMATSPSGPFTLLTSITAQTYTDTGLAANTTYYYTIQATNSGGTSTSNLLSITTPPPAPATLTATAGNTQVQLSWSAAAGATSYIIERGTVTGGPYTTVGTASGLSFTDSDLTNGTTYYYVVAGVSASGAGATSPEANATPSATVPVAPQSLSASGGSYEITLNWTASSGATSYSIYRASVTGGPYTLISSGDTGASYTDSGLPISATYYYVVTAVNDGGASAYSNEATATTQSYVVTYYKWDHLGASPASPADGAGSWNTTSALWSNGSADAAWVNNGENAAIFGNSNGAAGTVSVGSIEAADLTFNPPGSGSYILSSGTLTLSGTAPAIAANANVTIGSVLSGTGTFIFTGAGTVTLSGSNTYTGMTSERGDALVVSGGALATPEIALSATTTMVLSGAVNLSNVLTLNSGVATITSGTTSETSNTNTNFHLGAANSAATFAVSTGAVFQDTPGTSAFFNIGYGASSIGVLNNAGTVNISAAGGLGGNLGDSANASGAIYNTGILSQNSNSAGANGSGFYLGNQASAYGYIYNSGTLSDAGYLGLSRNDTASSTAGCGVVDVVGGAFTLTNAANLTLNCDMSDTNQAISQLDVTSGTFTAGSTTQGIVAVNGVANAYAAINVSGASAMMTMSGTSGINLNGVSSANNVATLTVAHGGTLNTSYIENTGSALSTGVLSLNSGTLVVTGSGTLIFSGVTTYVEASGITINNNGFNTTIASALQAPTGSGMTALVLEGTDTGYIGAPAVVVSGGGGTGAAAIATFNPATGTITSFRITSPGSGYTSTPTVTLYGGDGVIGAGAAVGTASAAVNTGAVTSGGITFTGSARTTLSAANTYSGATAISGGTVDLANGLALQDTTVSSVSGGLTFDSSVVSNAFTLGGLTGSGSILLENNAASPAAITLNIGNNGDNETYSGALSGSGALSKIGAGTQILSGACDYTGATNVLGGILEITGTLSGTSSLSVASNSVLYLAGGGLSVSGPIINFGTFKLSGAPTLSLTGTFTNNGVLDLINGPSALPPNFVNDGTVLDASNITVQQAAMSGTTFSVTILSYPQHTYQLQSSASLVNPSWTNVGSSQAGTGSVLTFTDLSASGTQGFYQIVVSP